MSPLTFIAPKNRRPNRLSDPEMIERLLELLATTLR